MNFVEVVLTKIDKKSKPIKKQEKLVNENLKRKRIFLEEENFDILTVLARPENKISNEDSLNGANMDDEIYADTLGEIDLLPVVSDYKSLSSKKQTLNQEQLKKIDHKVMQFNGTKNGCLQEPYGYLEDHK